jgi:hypothetical protein
MSPTATAKEKREARALVHARDKGYCQLCGIWFPHPNIHHRINKGSGGSGLFDRASLLVTLCGSGTTGDHGWVTANPKAARRASDGGTGFLLPRNNPDIDPELEPIRLFEGWFTLSDDGGRTSCESPLLAEVGE